MCFAAGVQIAAHLAGNHQVDAVYIAGNAAIDADCDVAFTGNRPFYLTIDCYIAAGFKGAFNSHTGTDYGV